MKTNNEEKKQKKITKRIVKKWLKKHAPIICVSIAAFLLLLVALLVVFQAEEELVQYQIKNENLYTYSLNHRLDFYTEVTLDHKNNVTKMLYNGEEITLFTEPIYYSDKKIVVFPNNMTFVFPLNGRTQRRINRYATIDAEGAQMTLKTKDLQYPITYGFIYDGDDVYFFTENGQITYDGKTIEVSKLSFVRCEYRGSLSIYDYKTQTMTYEESVKGSVIAKFKKYEVNMSSDTLIMDDEPSLIDKNVDAHPILSYEN